MQIPTWGVILQAAAKSLCASGVWMEKHICTKQWPATQLGSSFFHPQHISQLFQLHVETLAVPSKERRDAAGRRLRKERGKH